MYGEIARVEIGSNNAAPNFRVAMLLAMSGASADFGRVAEQVLLTPSDVHSLNNKNKEFALAAEHMIVTSKTLASDNKVSGETAQCLMYMLE